jgi:hypothetical protein
VMALMAMFAVPPLSTARPQTWLNVIVRLQVGSERSVLAL